MSVDRPRGEIRLWPCHLCGFVGAEQRGGRWLRQHCGWWSLWPCIDRDYFLVSAGHGGAASPHILTTTSRIPGCPRSCSSRRRCTVRRQCTGRVRLPPATFSLI